MSYDYTPLKQSADRLIQRFGQKYTFTRTTKGSYDPAIGTTTDTTSTFQKSGILFDHFDGDSAGQAVLAGDRRLVAEAHSYEVGDTLAINSETYRIVSVSANQPAGTMMLSTLQIRK